MGRRGVRVVGADVVMAAGLASVGRLEVRLGALLVRDAAVIGVGVGALPPSLAEEGHEGQAERVERGEPDRHRREDVGVERAEAMRGVGGLNDRVLGVEARREREADERQRADQHGPEGHRDLGAKVTHVPHILLVVHRGDD